MRVNSRTIISKDLATTSGWMAGNMRGPGRTIKCTEKESLCGQTAADMRESISPTKKKALGNSAGPMEDVTAANGKMASKMAKAPTATSKAQRGTGLG